jgi:amino acid adenylation domain-containing protein
VKLHELVANSAERRPDAVAVEVGDEVLRYGELDALSNRIAHALRSMDVRPGDRVGIWAEKGAAAIAAMQGTLRARGAYVPIDPLSPATRAKTILRDCDVAALITSAPRAAELSPELRGRIKTLLTTSGQPGCLGWDALASYPDTPPGLEEAKDDDLAYILYTSGSTGTPKGVCISHKNALSFIEWAAEELDARESDRFSNHAPFHFDLSVLDLYVPFLVGASVHVLSEQAAYVPVALVEFVREVQPTVWYSVPTALALMMQSGLGELDPLPMRAILFAGEPFPIEPLKRIRDRWPDVRLLNLYGPTETNVCTFYEVPRSLEGRDRPVPIGRPCSGNRAWVTKEDGSRAGVGEQGELVIDGPTVMRGYWGAAPQGGEPYPTGDLVLVLDDECYEYVGRRDEMLKIRGHRIEPAEIEAVLARHEGIEQACVVSSGGSDAALVAFLVASGPERPGLLALKRHCAGQLPRYMVIDKVRYLDALPRTRNGKLDRQALQEVAVSRGSV